VRGLADLIRHGDVDGKFPLCVGRSREHACARSEGQAGWQSCGAPVIGPRRRFTAANVVLLYAVLILPAGNEVVKIVKVSKIVMVPFGLKTFPHESVMTPIIGKFPAVVGVPAAGYPC